MFEFGFITSSVVSCLEMMLEDFFQMGVGILS